jgi:Carboxypeptidase regulatory-like domain
MLWKRTSKDCDRANCMKSVRGYLTTVLLWLGLFTLGPVTPVLPCNAQPVAQGTPASAAVAGIVLKQPGNEPVKKALIELIAENQNEAGNYTALSASDGSFRIENIQAGRYHLFVERTGYQEVNQRRHPSDGRVLTLSTGQEIKDCILMLQAAAVVEGRVTDEDGDPLPEAQVAVLRQTFVAGGTHWEQAGAERTNDLGEYRIPSLVPGNYFVSVTPPPNYRALIETSGKSASAHSLDANKLAHMSYQATYYPGTHDRSQASAIHLHAGDDFPINFSLTPSPSLTIRGSVGNLPAGASAAIMLQSSDFNLVLNGAEMHKDGSFEIRDVSPGAYTIFATVEGAPVPMMARQPVQLTSSNVEGVRLAPQPGGSINGHLRLETSNAPIRNEASQMFLQLRSADGDDEAPIAFSLGGASTVTQVNSDGSFEWKNVPPGRYFMQIADASSAPDWFLKSVSAGGSDASAGGFPVAGGSTTLDLVAAANGAVINGVVTEPKESSNDSSAPPQPGETEFTQNEPAANVTVVAVPEPRLRSRLDLYRKAVTDQAGHFTLRGLAPGNYTLFAWESVEGEAYYNADFLSAYESQGKPMHLSESERTDLQLKVIFTLENP